MTALTQRVRSIESAIAKRNDLGGMHHLVAQARLIHVSVAEMNFLDGLISHTDLLAAYDRFHVPEGSRLAADRATRAVR